MTDIKDRTVRETVQETGLSEHTLRYYEKIGLMEPVKRSNSGHRSYSQNDIDWIGFLKCLRSTGMPIETMKIYVDLQRMGDDRFENRLRIMQSHKITVLEKIEELNRYLTTIDYKINYYTKERDSIK
ncbi:MAG: MerR family transcriptional regulator [Spirochaetaceae bacterium]|jgi:DNA-binding transcriptional MerR regulator|nr:MerR family transcriptional regulator [Spirochaetaceae bacterium]